MPTDFAMIENYKRLLQSLESEESTVCNDQEVPGSQLSDNEQNVKASVKIEPVHQQDFGTLADFFLSSEIKKETYCPQDDLCNSSFNMPYSEQIMDSRDFLSTRSIASTSITSTSVDLNLSAPQLFTNSTSIEMMPVVSTSHSCSLSSSSLSSSSTHSSSSLSSSSLSSIITHSVDSKTKSYVTGLAGSGCTVTTNPSHYIPESIPKSIPDYLEDNMQEEIEYLDLDKPVSFYNDFESAKTPLSPLSCNIPKTPFQTPGEGDNRALEDAVLYMQEIILQDSENLNIPFDPHLWTCEHVYRWVDWICQKNKLQNMSKQAASFTGQYICYWTLNDFISHFGPSGQCLYHELDLWKAANSCQTMKSSSPSDTSFTSEHFLTPFPLSSSPALSNCGSNSSDSVSGVLSQNVDMIDEDNAFYPDVKPALKSEPSDNTKVIHKRVPGRGHKKAISLWQFLRKLLLSDQNYGCIRWIDRKAGIFKIEDSKKVATLWGAEKNRPAMNYDKLSRSVRQYYKKGIIKKPEQSKRLLYQFCPEYL